MNLVLSSYIVSKKKKKNLLIYVSLKETFHGIKDLSLELALLWSQTVNGKFVKWSGCKNLDLRKEPLNLMPIYTVLISAEILIAILTIWVVFEIDSEIGPW